MKNRVLSVIVLVIMLLCLTGCSIKINIKDKNNESNNNNNNSTSDPITDPTTNPTSTPTDNNGKNPTKSKAFKIGDDVTVKGEAFYVLENSSESNGTVTLFAKYNLNKEGTKQYPNAYMHDTCCEFSSTFYWQKVVEQYDDWDNKYLDLNNVSGNKEGDAITKARNYAKSLGAQSGRLLTYEEAFSLKDDYPDMIWGRANMQTDDPPIYFLYYYLSSVRKVTQYRVWAIRGGTEEFAQYADSNYGVRPVITISKSLID